MSSIESYPHLKFKYSNGLQVLRGLAALMIVFLHLGVAEARYGTLFGMKFLEGFRLGAAGVDIFFVISGFVMVLVTRNKLVTPVRFLAHRLSRIYPNYWVYFLLVTLTWMIRPEWVNSSLAGTPDFLSSLVLLPSRGVPAVSVAWTLEFEIFFYLVFALLLWISRARVATTVALTMSVLVLLGVLFQPANIILERITHPLILEFAAGAYLGQFMLYKRVPYTVLMLPLSLLIFTLHQFGFELADFLHLGEDFERVINFGIPAVLLVLGVVALDMRYDIKYPRLLINIGNASYTLYLSHILLISAAGKLWSSLGLNNHLSNLIFDIILLLACVVYALLAYVYIEKPLLKRTRKFLMNV